MIRCAIYFPAAILFFIIFSEGVATGLIMITMFLLEWFYPIYFEVLHDGQTPGKKRLAIKVIEANGVAVGWQASFIRNFLRFVDFLPFFYGFALLSSFIDKSSRRLGDLAAGTIVVYSESQTQGQKIPQIDPDYAPIRLTYSEEGAILAYSEKLNQLSKARQQELANLLQPLHMKEGPQAVTSIQAYAAGIQGHDEAKSI